METKKQDPVFNKMIKDAKESYAYKKYGFFSDRDAKIISDYMLRHKIAKK